MSTPEHRAEVARLIERKLSNLVPAQARQRRLDVALAYQLSGQLRDHPEHAELVERAKAMYEGLQFHPPSGVTRRPAEAVAPGGE